MVTAHRQSVVGNVWYLDVPKVLLIAAQDHLLELLRKKFEVEGFVVLTANSGRQGIELAKAELPELIVLDERLRDSRGTRLQERFKANRKLQEIPLILLTMRDSRAAGDAGYGAAISQLQLPFRPSQLVALAREAL